MLDHRYHFDLSLIGIFRAVSAAANLERGRRHSIAVATAFNVERGLQLILIQEEHHRFGPHCVCKYACPFIAEIY